MVEMTTFSALLVCFQAHFDTFGVQFGGEKAAYFTYRGARVFGAFVYVYVELTSEAAVSIESI